MQTGEQRDYNHLQGHVHKQEPKHRVHVRLKDTVEQIGELSIAPGELYEAKDGRNYENAHEEWLFGNRPDDFAHFTRFRSCLLNITSEGSKVAHRSI